MRNKLLFLVVVLLIPLTYISYNREIQQETIKEKEIRVNLEYNNQILDLSMKDYLIGVVGCEMPASFNDEALKAQAIAARTFAYNFINNDIIKITTGAQCYLDNNKLKDKWQDDYDTYYNKISNVVNCTNNLVIKYNNEIIKSYYYAMSNGKTEDSLAVFNQNLPYLTIVDSPFESTLKNFEVETSLTYDNFCNLLSINPCEINISNIVRDESDRVESLIINDIKYSGIDIRKKLSLRSTDFNIDTKDNEIVVTTKGYGHGVGMSQYGANYLANQGMNYEEILKYYYNDVDIVNYQF